MSTPKPTFVIACGVFSVDLKILLAEVAPDSGTCFLPGGLHENPVTLREQVQQAINEASDAGSWGRIAIAYGLCGRGTAGLQARDIPLAIPRVPDCIALFLGSRERYHEEFKSCPGTYYLSAGWHTEKSEPLRQRRGKISIGEQSHTYAELVERYGEAAAEQTFNFFNSWKKNYKRAAFIDTGHGDAAVVSEYAQAMADEHGWAFEKIAGDMALLRQLLSAETTDANVLVVPPGQVTHYDPMMGGLNAHPLSASPVEKPSLPAAPEPELRVSAEAEKSAEPVRIGLGIDAGGTYTDAVIYDFAHRSVGAKNKALTTRWNFMRGISEVLDGLPEAQLNAVELVSVSTTLATNAVVEGDGQTVGLLVMPPYGLSIAGELNHRPAAVIDGQIDISGEVRSPIDPNQIRTVAEDMIATHGVTAFAVSGYAGSVNPEHEMAVKAIIETATGCLVTCGHELSRLLNFKTRAQTAVLNARIVPRLVDLLGNLKNALKERGISAPIMVVKGDGSLMSCELAMQRPVETILSGPAASVAGAKFLTDIEGDAMVVDIGGTTTDTAALADGQVAISEQGATVGGIHTHVRALDIRTAGLGGDSLIGFEKNNFTIGPRRVAPLCWLGAQTPGPQAALAYLKSRSGAYRGSGHALQILTATGRRSDVDLTQEEGAIMALLTERPHAVDELAQKAGTLHAALLPLKRLEERFLIQRCGLTPTDLLHIQGSFERWDPSASEKMLAVMAAVSSSDPQALVDKLLNQMIEDLARELIKKQLAETVPANDLSDCATCKALVQQMLAPNNGGPFAISFKIQQPLLGIGAPTGHFLPQAATLLGTKAVMPDHWEVANAVGAITSPVIVTLEAQIKPDPRGGFAVQGLAGDHRFSSVEEAQDYAQTILQNQATALAKQAGTDASRVRLVSEDKVARTATGFDLFISRKVAAQIVGVPVPDLLDGGVSATGMTAARH